MPQPLFTFSLVVYSKYETPVENCRCTVYNGRCHMSYEKGSWVELFKVIRQLYGAKLQFNIPDRLEVIRY